MPADRRVRAWVAQHYQRPAVDQEWLADCSDWLSSELGLDPNRDLDQFVQHVEAQLLQSNLADSTVSGSGIDPLLFVSNPRRQPTSRRGAARAPRPKKTTGPTPLLVEIKSITEIAYSAFSLLNTHQTRLDRADLGLAREENAEQHRDEDEGPIPRFPRGMLEFELSDGLTTFRAIEFRSLPQLELGTTPLGYKMLLKSTPIRNGIAFLEPTNAILKGYRTEDHDINSEQVFLSLLRKRLGRPDPPPEQPAQPPSGQPARQYEAPSVAQPQPPPAGIDDMYADDEVDPDVLREMTSQLDEAIDAQENRPAGVRPQLLDGPVSISKENPRSSSNPKPTSNLNTVVVPRSPRGPSSTSSVKTSSYFTAHISDSKSIPDIGLSPLPAPLPDLESDDAGPSKLTALTRASSPDPFDDLSFDIDVNASFFEQVGMIERSALAIGTDSKGKGKAKHSTSQSTSYGRRSAAGEKTPSGSALGTKYSATRSVSPSGAESSLRVQGGTRRATSASSLSSSTEAPMPQSTRSSGRRLPRDLSLIVISSSEDEAPEEKPRPLDLARKRAPKRRRMDQVDVAIADSDVIDISD